MSSPAYHRPLNWLIRIWSLLTLILITAGALTAGNHAGLSIPDWPLAYGKLVPPFIGGIRYEYTHRVIATLVGCISIVVAIWLERTDPRGWMRRLGWIGVGGVILQGILGGLTVLMYQPPWITAAHASVAQLFFLLTVGLAVFTGRGWLADIPQCEDLAQPSLFSLGISLTAAIWIQIILGAAYRHDALGVTPHMLGAVVVTGLAIWLAGRMLAQHGEVTALRQPAWGLLLLLLVQVGLGIWTYFVKLATQQAPQPPPARIALATLHLVCGSLLLGLAFWITLRLRRYVQVNPWISLQQHKERSLARVGLVTGATEEKP